MTLGAWSSYSPQTSCPRCGSDNIEARKDALWTRLWQWFIDGTRGQNKELVCSHGHTWSAPYGSQLRRMHRGRWWHAIAFNRTVIPTPSSYSVAFVAGTIVGALARVAFGLRFWWLGGLVAVVLAFLTALSTAFRGPQRHRTRRSLQDLRDPRGAMSRRRAERDQAITDRSFSIYGLADTPVQPTLGGMTRRATGLTSLIVSYLNPADGPHPAPVEVETELLEGHDAMPQIADANENDSAATFERWVSFHKNGDTRGAAFLQPGDTADAPIEWQASIMVIDGQPHDARFVREDDATLIIGRTKEVRITVRSLRPMDTPVLKSIDPPADYASE